MSDNNHSIPEDEVNKMLADQHEKHVRYTEDKLRQQAIEHNLEDISKSVKHIDSKVCSYIGETEENNKKIMLAIENVGTERRQCEDDIKEKIEKKVSERNELIEKLNNHVNNNFVTTKSLNKMAAIIIVTVGFTVSAITYIGQSKHLDSDQIKVMIQTVVKEMKKGG